MSPDSSAAAVVVSPAPASPPAPAAPVAPVSRQVAAAVLGSMLFLIVALTVLLVQNTLVEPASAAEAPVAQASFTADGGSLAQR